MKRQLARTMYERVANIELTIPPTVHNPVVFRAGAFLADTLRDTLQPIDDTCTAGRTRPRVLDLGTGSGIGSIVAANQGYDVVAIDINRAAVRCSRANAEQNRVGDRITTIQGDLFEPFRDRSFDLVLFNPPFFTGRPRDLVDAAWKSSDVLERFAAGLMRVMHPGGSAMVVFSSNGDEQRWWRALREYRLTAEELTWKDLGNEILTVYIIRGLGAEA